MDEADGPERVDVAGKAGETADIMER